MAFEYHLQFLKKLRQKGEKGDCRMSSDSSSIWPKSPPSESPS